MTTNITPIEALKKIKEISQTIISGKFKWDIPKGSNRISAVDIMTNYAKEIKAITTQALAQQECDVTNCKYYCEGYYSDDIGYEETDKINACGLTRTGYHEMSYKKCSDITNCYYKQLLAEQAKNKKLVEALQKIAYRDITIKSNFYSSTVANEALNEVNKRTMDVDV